MEQLPTREYGCEEGSPAAELLETLGVFLVQGRQVVTLDPILMVALLALQRKVVPTVKTLVEQWRKEDKDTKEEYGQNEDQPE